MAVSPPSKGQLYSRSRLLTSNRKTNFSEIFHLHRWATVWEFQSPIRVFIPAGGGGGGGGNWFRSNNNNDALNQDWLFYTKLCGVGYQQSMFMSSSFLLETSNHVFKLTFKLQILSQDSAGLGNLGKSRS